jgi:hypothetical protein
LFNNEVVFVREMLFKNLKMPLKKYLKETQPTTILNVQMCNLVLIIFLGRLKTGSGCCGYGTMATGKVTVGNDCVIIPQALTSG